MVRALLLAAVAAFAAGAAACEPDWRAAGGDLFADTPPAATSAEADDLASPRLPPLRQPFAQAISVAAAEHGLDPKLLHALVLVESRYRADAVSRAGAVGLTQLMPDTARELGVTDRRDPAENLRAGADFLARQLLRFGDVRLALAAFNAGPARVAAIGRVPSIAETQVYVERVLACYLALAAGRTVTNASECRSPGR